MTRMTATKLRRAIFRTGKSKSGPIDRIVGFEPPLKRKVIGQCACGRNQLACPKQIFRIYKCRHKRKINNQE